MVLETKKSYEEQQRVEFIILSHIIWKAEVLLFYLSEK